MDVCANKLKNIGERLISSIDLLFNGYFLLSENNEIFEYKVKDQELNLFLGEKSLQGQEFLSLISPLIAEKEYKQLKQAILDRNALIIEVGLRKNGEITYYEIFFLNLEENQFLVVFRNTDKKRVLELELAQERNTLRNILELNPYAIEIKDAEGRHVSANHAFIDMFETTAPREYSIFEDPYLKEIGLLDELLKLKEGKVVKLPEHWYNPHDIDPDYPNSRVCHNVVVFPIFDNNENIKNYVFMHEDVSEKRLAEKELEKERLTLKNIIELNPYAIEIFDNEGNHIGNNKAYVDLYQSVPPLGYNVFKDPLHKKTGIDLLFRRALDGEVVYSPENWYNPNDLSPELPDKLVCHNTSIFPIFDSNGKVEKLIAMFEDITERKQIEKKLRESEERFRSLVETTSDWIWEVDEKGIYTYISPKIKDLLGYEPEEVIGKTPFDLMPPNEVERIRKFFQAISENQESFARFENTNLHKDRRYIILETSGVPIFNEYGDFLGYRGIDRDITERKRAEQSLKESEQKYRHLFNNTPYAIWLVNLRGQIIDCNETMNKLMSIFKYTDLIGKSFRDIIKMFLNEGDPRFENLDHVFKERFKRLLKQGYLEPIEFEISRGDGKKFWITLETSFVSVGKDRLIQVFIKDITEKKLAEIELDFLRKDLENRVRERTIKLQNSEKKYRKAYNRANCFKGLFTHDISNMFNTIGNSIELCESLLKEGVTTDNTLEYFDLIEQQIKRGKKLIYNIRNLSEMEESEMRLESTEILKKLRSAFQFVRVNFQKHDIKMDIESDYDETFVLANELLLDVFENILINSVNYNKSETIEINIKISKLKKNDIAYIKLEFKDNGIGIDDSRKIHIFEENYKKRIGTKGMGLGLSLVAKLLDLCEGKIWVEDRIKGDYTQGSNFVILIPEVNQF